MTDRTNESDRRAFEAAIRNAALEEAAKAVETAQVPGSLLRPGLAKIIRALKSDASPAPDPKPFTFADPAAQLQHERHRAESRRERE